MADRGHFDLANGGQFEWIFHYGAEINYTKSLGDSKRSRH